MSFDTLTFSIEAILTAKTPRPPKKNEEAMGRINRIRTRYSRALRRDGQARRPFRHADRIVDRRADASEEL